MCRMKRSRLAMKSKEDLYSIRLIKSDIGFVSSSFTVTTTERNFLKKEIKRMFAGNNDLQVYKDFFAWAGKPELFKMR